MRLTYRQIEYLREVARQNSITDAGKELGISQSSILAAIDVAEEVTGTRLFARRKGHGIEMTPAGHKFLVSVRRFLASGDDFERSLAQFTDTTATMATIRIGCFIPFGALLIPPIVKRYLEAYGDCEIILLEGDQTQLRSWLATGDVDVVVTYDIGQEYGSGVTPICKFPTHGILNIEDPLAHQESVSMEDLAQRPLILLDLPETRTYLMSVFDLATQRPKIGLRTRSYETVRSAVLNNLGISILNIRPALDTSPDSANLVRVPISDQLRQPTLLVADPYGDKKPDYVRSFIHVLYQYFVDLGPENFAVVLPEYSHDLIYPRPKF
ncbi:MAG: LysR family transcriptional regulator [Rhizobiaceae bacterium]|nr:LysR family transcriptional regulator [Rhizobiaceae bacterium]